MARFSLDQLSHPIVQAPLAGGPSTAALAAAVSEAGGLGFLAAGYKSAAAVGEEIAAVREATERPFGVNLFVPSSVGAGEGGPRAESVARYADAVRSDAERLGAEVGEPRQDDDGWGEKLALVRELRPAVVSFAFGLPQAETVAGLQAAGCAVWVTVTTPAEARTAAAVGADALGVQGVEAGGHRGSFDDGAPGEIGLLALLQLVRSTVDLPLVAAGGIMTGGGIAAALAAGARAVQLGSAFMLTPEAGTSAPHRAALAVPGDTALTRAFSGRLARGIVNRFMRDHGAGAPSAYPEVHHITSPLRAAARASGDGDAINLWAGQAHELARAVPAGELVRTLSDEARAALGAAAERL
ncbi:MAG TPA: nitronate monooxygenase [Conexibacter sp.]|jgi:nitronate monooxygenase